MFCKNCGQALDENAVICPFCGVATSKIMNNFSSDVSYDYGDGYGKEKKLNGLGIAGFVVGLVGMFGGNFLYLMPGIVALVLSIIGVVQIKKCSSCNGLAIAGLVISIISFVFWLIIWIYAFMIIIEEGILLLL